ncbi:MAG: hypothetical protein ABSH48_13440 [Verrucomicrobiota bacterium]|jgi:hypothetical protein
MINPPTIPQIRRANLPFRSRTAYCNLSRAALSYGIGANVFLEARVLRDYSALWLAPGCTTADAVLAVLVFRRPVLSEGTLSVCLTRRSDGRTVEAQLRISCRDQVGHESVFLQLGPVRGL